MNIFTLSEKERENALNEVRILASCQNKNVISYKEAFIESESNSLCIIMEYANNKDLYQRILDYTKKKEYMKENDIWRIFIQIVRGLKSLHDLNIMHRDLKSANVFLHDELVVKLGDMNVSRMADKQGLNYTQTGTPYYASPEVWKDKPYDFKSDIWSLGCVLYESITLRPPFRASDMQGLFDKVVKGTFPRIPKKFSVDLSTVIKGLLQVKAKNRPTCDQILTHPIIVKRIKKLGMEEFFDNSILMKTIQSFNDPNKILYNLPAPTYTSTETTTLKDQLQKASGFPDIKNSFEYKSQFPVNSESTIGEDQSEFDNHGNVYNNKHKLSHDVRDMGRKIKHNRDKIEDYQSPYVQNQYKAKRNLSNKLQKNGSAGSVISAKKSIPDSDTSGLMIRNTSKILDSIDRPSELPLIDKTKSQDNVLTENSNANSPEQASKFTPERYRDQDSRLSSENNINNRGRIKNKNNKNEKYLQKAIEPSEFKMRTDNDDSQSPSRRILETKKSRLKSNQSKGMNRNDSQSQLSSK